MSRKSLRMCRNGWFGFTLAETVVYVLILGILLGITAGIFNVARNSVRTGDTRTGLSINAKAGIDSIAHDLQWSDISTFINRTSSDPCYISFKSAFDVNGRFQFDSSTGLPVWQRNVIYYLDKEKALLMRADTDPLAGTLAEQQAKLDTIVTNLINGVSVANTRRRVVACSVVSITAAAGTNNVTVDLATNRIYAGQPTTSVMRGEIYFRN